MTHLQEQLLSAEQTQPPEPDPAVHGCDVARCRWCGARVLWANMLNVDGTPRINPDTGRQVRNPLNPQPDPDGRLRLVGRGRALAIARGENVPCWERHTSHWATCKRIPPAERKAAAQRAQRARRTER